MEKLWDKIKGVLSKGEKTRGIGPDKYPLAEGDPLSDAHHLVTSLLEHYDSLPHISWRPVKLDDSVPAQVIADTNPEVRSRIIAVLACRVMHLNQRIGQIIAESSRTDLSLYLSKSFQDGRKLRHVLHSVALVLLRSKNSFESNNLLCLLTWLKWWNPIDHNPLKLPHNAVIGAVENFSRSQELTSELRAGLGELLAFYQRHSNDRELRNLSERIRILLGDTPRIPMQIGEAWTNQALADIERLSDKDKCAWAELLIYCQTASGGQPSSKWMMAAASAIEKVGIDDFKTNLLRWLPLVGRPRTEPLVNEYGALLGPLVIPKPYQDVLKGLAWCCSTIQDRDIARALTVLAISSYRKIPGVGPRAPLIGNACAWALGQMPGLEAIGQLAVLKVRLKSANAQKSIDKALNAAAERERVPRQDLEEMAVAAYGLTEVGRLSEPMGDFTAQLTITGTNSTELIWLNADGKTQKSVPAAVKKDFAEDLKELKQAEKDVQKMLPAQRDRLDGLYLQQKKWDLATWRKRYFDHPLVGTLARRLIWRFTRESRASAGIWWESRYVDHAGHSLDWFDDSTQVELWHPIHESIETVQGWRSWLVEHEVKQPFKQAHRETYLLTDAERNTRVYSNRFAAHIIRQHQFNALCAARGWKNQLRLMVDAEYQPPTRLLLTLGLRAEFWVDSVGDDYGRDTNETGTFLYLGTDQVRFYAEDAPTHSVHAAGDRYGMARDRTGQANEPIPLERIPPLVFTEIMRDVDLFVGVASVGNDPAWLDGGPNVEQRNYWNTYSFGELSESAKTRRQVLERLLPHLKIAKRCKLSDKFLVVEGDLRTYKIHLGSANILMEPNDQYLCIVEARGQAKRVEAGKVFLPFEGDERLAIILSKAFLLAEDKKIEDPSILRQIKPERRLRP